MDLMKSTMAQLEAELKRGGAAIELLQKLLRDHSADGVFPDDHVVGLRSFPGRHKITLGDIRAVVAENPFSLGE